MAKCRALRSGDLAISAKDLELAGTRPGETCKQPPERPLSIAGHADDRSHLASLEPELKNWVRREIGPFASPDVIQFAPGLPKTRSGKIMRRILRKVAEGDIANLGDTSTLAGLAVVDELVRNRA